MQIDMRSTQCPIDVCCWYCSSPGGMNAKAPVQAAAVDEATRFRRLYRLADGAELLVTVRRDDGDPEEASGNGAESGAEGSGPTVVTLTTSAPNEMVLHWGVSKNDKAWVLPPKPLWKQVTGSMADAGGAVHPPLRFCPPFWGDGVAAMQVGSWAAFALLFVRVSSRACVRK